jgi:dihydropteroate synthase
VYTAEVHALSRYLVPRGLIFGPAAARAIEADLDCRWPADRWDAMAEAMAEAIERDAGEEGQRRLVSLQQARALVPDLVEGLANPRPHWAGFDLKRPLIMGVVNVTPDSFSEGGDCAEASHAIDHARAMLAAGTD